MLKKHMAACLVTTALLAAPALAQTSGSSTGGSSGASASSANAGKFLTEEKANQWRASKLVGINVYGPNNEKVGDINEVLVDRNGKAEAVVIGVGGFLGIGEKDVALPFDQVQWSDRPVENRNASGGAGSGAAGSAAGTGMAGTGTAGGTAGTTGSTGATTGSTGSTAGTSGGTAGSSGSASSTQARGYPDHATITMSKDELKNAPSFRYAGNTSRDNNAGGNRSGAGATGAGGAGTGGAAGTGAGTAPRQ